MPLEDLMEDYSIEKAAHADAEQNAGNGSSVARLVLPHDYSSILFLRTADCYLRGSLYVAAVRPKYNTLLANSDNNELKIRMLQGNDLRTPTIVACQICVPYRS